MSVEKWAGRMLQNIDSKLWNIEQNLLCLQRLDPNTPRFQVFLAVTMTPACQLYPHLSRERAEKSNETFFFQGFFPQNPRKKHLNQHAVIQARESENQSLPLVNYWDTGWWRQRAYCALSTKVSLKPTEVKQMLILGPSLELSNSVWLPGGKCCPLLLSHQLTPESTQKVLGSHNLNYTKFPQMATESVPSVCSHVDQKRTAGCAI